MKFNKHGIVIILKEKCCHCCNNIDEIGHCSRCEYVYGGSPAFESCEFCEKCTINPIWYNE